MPPAAPFDAEVDGRRAVGRERTTIRYSPSDVAALLWRRLPLMLVVFLVVAALGVFAALRLKTTYPAHSSLLIRLGPEYVYNPAVGDAGRGTAPDNDQVVQSELEILQSQAVKAKTVQDIGVARMSPALGRAYATASPDKRRDIEAAAIKMIDSGLKVAAAPDNSIVRLSYSAADPELSALVLNTLVDEYLHYRRTLLIDKVAGPVQAELKSQQDRLAAADQAYQKFLIDNGVSSGDFETEKASLNTNYAQLTTEQFSVQAALSEAEGRLGAARAQLAGSQAEINLYRDPDHTAQDEVAKLRLQRQDLLSRYLPNTQPVRDIEQKIAAAEALARHGPDDGGARRIGPNPIYQTLVSEKNQAEAQVAALRVRQGKIAALLAGVTQRRQTLAGLEPRYQDLARQRDLLTANVKALAQRAQESQAAEALAKGGDGNIRVIERAYPATSGVSLKTPVMMLSLVFAAFAALCAGLLSAFLARGYPTTETVERTFHMPVLAAAPVIT